MKAEEIKQEIKEFIVQSIIKSEAVKIEFNTALISGGFIDSISTLQLVDYLEKKFKIEFQPNEVDRDNLDSIDLIADFVISKL